MLAVHKFGFKNMILYTFQIVIWVFSWHHFRNLVKCCDVKRNRCTKTTWRLPSLCKRYCLWRWKCHVDTPIQHFWHTRWRFHWKGLKTVPSRISATNAMRYSVLYSLTRPCFSWNCFFAHGLLPMHELKNKMFGCDMLWIMIDHKIVQSCSITFIRTKQMIFWCFVWTFHSCDCWISFSRSDGARPPAATTVKRLNAHRVGIFGGDGPRGQTQEGTKTYSIQKKQQTNIRRAMAVSRQGTFVEDWVAWNKSCIFFPCRQESYKHVLRICRIEGPHLKFVF